MKIWHGFVACVGSLYFMVMASASPVAIVNSSFEEDPIAGPNAPVSEVRTLAPTGWEYLPDGPSDRGLIAPITANKFYPSSPRGLDGAKAFFITGGMGTGGIRQVLEATLEPETKYTLSVSTGTRIDGSPFGGYGITLETVSGVQVIHWEGVGRNPASPGTFAVTSRSMITGSNPSGLGEKFQITLNRPAGANGYVDLDHVTLTAEKMLSESNDGSIDVYLVAGQSNAHGWGVNSSQLSPVNRHYAIVAASQALLAYKEKNLPDPLYSTGSIAHLGTQGAGFGGNCDGFGPELSLGTDLADGLKKPVVLLKFAVGSAGLAANFRKNNPLDPSTANHLYPVMIDFINASLKQLKELGYSPNIKALFWLQGESDTGNEQMARDYQKNVTDFISDLRGDLNAPAMKVFLTEINGNAPAFSPNLANVGMLNKGMSDLASVDGSRIYYISVHDINKGFADPIHYSADQEIDIGQRWAKSYVKTQDTSASEP